MNEEKAATTPLGPTKRSYEETGDYQPKSVVTTRMETCQNLFCWTFTGIVVFLFIAGLAIGFFVLLSRPHPTITTMQGVAPGDTVPLYYSSKTEIPQGGSKTWYESLTISFHNTEVAQPETVVSLVKASYIKGAQLCSPPAGNIQTKTEQEDVSLEPNSPKAISAKPFYFTNGATFSLNFTLTSPDSTTLLIYVLDSIDEYNCLIAKTCSPQNPRSFNLSSGDQDSFSEIFSISSYYFVVLSSSENENTTLAYSYEATSHYYNHTDYSDRTQSKCTLTQEKSCTLNIVGNFDECALAYTVPGTNVEFVPLKVVAHHRRFNFVSIAFFALFVASLSLVMACLLSVVVVTCFRRRRRKSGYSMLM